VNEVAAKSTKAAPELRFEVITPENYPALYTNNAQISTSPFDLRIDFSDATQSGDVIKIRRSVQVVVSMAHARAFLDALQHSVDSADKRAVQGEARAERK
jgi:hypothetical protein